MYDRGHAGVVASQLHHFSELLEQQTGNAKKKNRAVKGKTEECGGKVQKAGSVL